MPYFAHIGNNSQSEQYKAGQRFADLFDQGRIPLVLHLADHDPNGIDMTRDNTERLELYARQEVEVRRIALNIDQVRRYNPPPNFAKETDSRYAAYAAQYGEECWELDALSPTVIADLIRTEIKVMVDAAKWQKREVAERRNRAVLDRVSQNWAKGCGQALKIQEIFANHLPRRALCFAGPLRTASAPNATGPAFMA